MRTGFILPNNWGLQDPALVVEFAVKAEQLGFDSVWVNHHILNVGYIADRLGTKPYYDALSTLAWVGASTTDIKLGTSVLVLPYLHPMVLAKELATIDQLSKGRLIVGVGVGSLIEENEVLRAPWKDRGAYSDEALGVMRALWESPTSSYDGERFAFAELEVGPQPFQSPLPVWVGGASRHAISRAARLGNGWHPMCSSQQLQRAMPQLVDALEKAGRSRADIVIGPRVDAQDLADAGSVADFELAGADQLIVGTSTADPNVIDQELERIASLCIDHQ